MIYIELFLGFIKVGFLSFGGAYSAIPIVREIAHTYGWLTDEELSYMIAVGESTPGPIIVNLATYVGSCKAGFLGALIATFASVFPAFLIIVLMSKFLKDLSNTASFKGVLFGVEPCVIGIIFSTGVYMTINSLFITRGRINVSLRALILTVILICVMVLYRKIKKKRISPIIFILISAIVGIAVNKS